MQKKMLSSQKSWRHWKGFITALACVVVFCTTYMLILPAITATKNPTCGKQEHTHTESCYSQVQVCDLNEGDFHQHTVDCYQTDNVLVCTSTEEIVIGHTHSESCILQRPELGCELLESEEHTHNESCYTDTPYYGCGLNETEGGHQHTESCYEPRQTLVCQLSLEPHTHKDDCFRSMLTCGEETHVHTEECYEERELEIDLDEWRQKLPEKTGQWAADLLAAAKSQLHYPESKVLIRTDDDGSVYGYTMYGDTYGVPYDNWDAAFVSWCLKKIDVPDRADPDNGITVYFPQSGDTTNWMDALKAMELFHEGKDGYEPEPGDLVFFTVDGGSGNQRVAVLESFTRNEEDQRLETMTMYMGDCENQVDVRQWYVGALTIQGWARLPQNPELYPPQEQEQEPEPEPEEVEVDGMMIPAECRDLMRGFITLVENPAPSGKMRMRLAPMALNEDPEKILNNSSTAGEVHSRTVKYRIPGQSTEWQPVANNASIPANASFQVTVEYVGMSPQEIREMGYQAKYKVEEYLTKIQASGTIGYQGEVRGYITGDDGYITLHFDQSFIDSLCAMNNSTTIDLDFTYEGGLDLKRIEEEGGDGLNLGDIHIQIPAVSDARAEFAEVELDKALVGGLETDEATGKHYLTYTLTVTAGGYGSPNVKVVDRLTAGASYVAENGRYPGLTGTLQTAQDIQDVNETITNGGNNPNAGKIFLTSQTTVNSDGSITANDSGTNLAWDIGDMGPNEVRTLTYKIEVNDTYLGIPHDSNDTIKNQADLFSRTYPRGTDTTSYLPTAQATVQKSHGQPQFNDETKLWEVDYTIVVTANPNNVYTLTNVKLTDNATGYDTNDGYAQHIALLTDTVRFYNGVGDGKTERELTTVQTPPTNANPLGAAEIYYSGGTANDQPFINDFAMNVGDLEPGEARTITYRMTLDEVASQPLANGGIGIWNNAEIYPDVAKKPNANRFNNATQNFQVSSLVWERKLGGAATRSDVVYTITNPSHVYDLTSGTLQQVSKPPSNYAIPAGSMRYTVVVNEEGTEGNWDVTGATLKDTLGTNTVLVNGQQVPKHIVKFTDYVEICVLDHAPSTNNEEELQNWLVNNRNRVQSVYWVKIDNMTGFNLSLKDLGLTGSNAYILTYYTEFDGTVSNWGEADISNQMSMSGQVGNGGNMIQLDTRVQASKRTVEPGVEDPVKRGWYYDPNDTCFVSTGLGTNGALYWVTEMSGSKIPEGTYFQDSTRFNTPAGHWPDSSKPPRNLARANSSVGFYSGNLGVDENGDPITIQSLYPTIDDFMAAVDAGVFHEIPRKTDEQDGYYVLTESSWPSDDKGHRYYDVTIQFTSTYALLNGERLYWVYRTEPGVMPSANSYLDYTNKINYKTPTGRWQDPKSYDTMAIADNSNGIRKQAGSVFMVKNSDTSGTWGTYFNNAEFYKISGKGLENAYGSSNKVSTSSGDGSRNNRELQNSLLMIGDSRDQVKSLISSNTAGSHNTSIASQPVYRFANDQYLNYRYSDGYYVTWIITVNTKKELSGPFVVEDILPEGVQLEYVRMYSKTGGYNGSKLIQNASICATEEHDFGAGWQNKTVVSNLINTSDGTAYWENTVTDYAVSDDGRFFKIYMPNVDKNQFVTFQVVCKATDINIFEDTTYTNQVQLQTTTGEVIDERGADVTIRGQSANKSALVEGLVNGAVNTTVFPYKIDVNPDALDMDPNNSHISVPLIDRMSSNLNLVNDTLMIFQGDPCTGDGDDWSRLLYYGGTYVQTPEGITDAQKRPWHTTDTTKIGKAVGYLGSAQPGIVVAVAPSVDANGTPILFNGTQMKQVAIKNLPDATKLTVCYSVTATFSEGGTSFSNKAFWEGYENNQNGEVNNNEVYYHVESQATVNTHGALQITKFDASDESVRLEGAKFALYRALYHEASAGRIEWEPDVPDAVKSRRYLGVCFGSGDGCKGDMSTEITVRRNAQGNITQVLVPSDKNDFYSSKVWKSLSDALTEGYNFHHDLVYDQNGNVQVYWDEVLSRGQTDAQGNLTYGLAANLGTLLDEEGNAISYDSAEAQEQEDRIHYNKIYAVVEFEAPPGYDLDSTPHFFVIPKSNIDMLKHNDLNNGSYFNHANWPSGVHVVSQYRENQPTYLLYMSNTRNPLEVTKLFGGSINGLKPGTYYFGIWSEANGLNPTRENMIKRAAVAYTEEDIAWYRTGTDSTGVHYLWIYRQDDQGWYGIYRTNNEEQVYRFGNERPNPEGITYGIIPGHERTATFVDLPYGKYYVYELNSAGYPSMDGQCTIDGMMYHVSLSGTAMESDAAKNKVDYKLEHTEITAVNRYFDVGVTKAFRDANLNSMGALSGTYTFGIWAEANIGENGMPIAGKPMASDIVQITWDKTEQDVLEKTAYFRNLNPGTAYRIYELSASADGWIPADDGQTVNVDTRQFVVDYPDGNTVTTLSTTENGTPPLKKVDNVSGFFTLPHTGGMGTKLFTFGGLTLTLLACFGYSACLLLRRRGKGDRP